MTRDEFKKAWCDAWASEYSKIHVADFGTQPDANDVERAVESHWNINDDIWDKLVADSAWASDEQILEGIAIYVRRELARTLGPMRPS